MTLEILEAVVYNTVDQVAVLVCTCCASIATNQPVRPSAADGMMDAG